MILKNVPQMSRPCACVWAARLVNTSVPAPALPVGFQALGWQGGSSGQAARISLQGLGW